jgi:hypothetical protein
MTQHPEFTNADRAQRAKEALEGYNSDNDAATNAVDFLTDLQHLYNFTKAESISHHSFDETLEIARGHYEAEIKGEDQ